MKVCSVEGCENKYFANGFCNYHYHNDRYKRGLHKNPKHQTLLERRRNVKFRKSNYLCEICGKPANDIHHKDHNRNNHSFSNLQVLCRSCHRKSHPCETGRKRILDKYALWEVGASIGISRETVRNYFRHPDKVSLKTSSKIDYFLNHQQAVGE